MAEFHKDLLNELIKDWDDTRLETYIHELEDRVKLLNEWIRHVRTVRRKRTRKSVFNNDTRGGKG